MIFETSTEQAYILNTLNELQQIENIMAINSANEPIKHTAVVPAKESTFTVMKSLNTP